jgi:hypothetical protein
MVDPPTPGELGRRLDRLEAQLAATIPARALEEARAALEARVAHLEDRAVEAGDYRRNRNIALAGALLGALGGVAAVLIAALVH